MFELANCIPDVDMLVALEPEELGMKLLPLIKARREHMFYPDTLRGELWSQSYSGHPQYPRSREQEVTAAVTEAWAWLEAQILVVPAAGMNGQNGWRVLSRRALKIESEADFTSFKTAQLLPRKILHPKIADPVWRAFVRGEFDVAAFQAMKAVEVSVREASGLGDGMLGVKLMRAAFGSENGPLTDMGTEAGERVGRMDLFAGAISCYKNPHSHRDVNLDDPAEAIEIILLANHLLRIVDARAKPRA